MSKKKPVPISNRGTAGQIKTESQYATALKNKKYQTALELIKEIYKADSTPANLERLQSTYLLRARQLREQRHEKDAICLIEAALPIAPSDTAWQVDMLMEMARCGAGTRLLNYLGKNQASLATATDEQGIPLGESLRPIMADAAFLDLKSGRDRLPADLQTDYDLIVKAFDHVAAGRDDEARMVLQGIGLKSPFLQWKLLLRGFMAYYVHDDARALENWQRLIPSRLPARLAASFRAAIDPIFLAAQTPDVQVTLSRQAYRANPLGLENQLHHLQTMIDCQGPMPNAFRIIETLLPRLRKEEPALIPRLARLMYWRMLKSGPDDVPRYQRVFGYPPDDPSFNRLAGLALEQTSDLSAACEFWAAYAEEIAKKKVTWPGQHAALAQALIWQHIGKIASSNLSNRPMTEINNLLDIFSSVQPECDWNAEKCFSRSIALAPNLIRSHELYIQHLFDLKKEKLAIQAAEQLLKVAPDHVATRKRLGQLYQKKGQLVKAREHFEEALQHHPFDKELRESLASLHLRLARQLMENKKWPEARKHLDTANSLEEGRRAHDILCRLAVIEYQNGNQERGDELVAEARKSTVGDVVVTYCLMREVLVQQLGPPLKTKLGKEFPKELKATTSHDTVIHLLRQVERDRSEPVTFVGMDAQEKKIITQALAVGKTINQESELAELLELIVRTKSTDRAIKTLLNNGRKSYPLNPHFPYIEALYYSISGRSRKPNWEMALVAITLAEKNAMKWPASDPARGPLLEKIDQAKKEITPNTFQINQDFLRLFQERVMDFLPDFEEGE